MEQYSDLTQHGLEHQHGLAYEVSGTLLGYGLRPSMQIGGGGILEVTAPLFVAGRDNAHQIRFSSYVEDQIWVMQELEGEWEEVWHLPQRILEEGQRPWVMVADFLNELEKALGVEKCRG